MSTTPSVLTHEEIFGWTTAKLKDEMKNPARLAEINAALALGPTKAEETNPLIGLQPSLEELDAVKVEADRLAAEQAAAQAIAEKTAQDAKDAEYKAAGVTVETDTQGNIIKIIKTYQAKDPATGNPIGRPTYLEAKSWIEMSIKQQQAHENAVQFAERLKKQKLTIKKEEPKTTVQPALSDEDLIRLQEELKGEDRDKATEAAATIRKHETEKVEVDLQEQLKLAIENARQKEIALDWLSQHPEFNRCIANREMIQSYLTDNNLEFTLDNLELTYAAVESQLTPKEEKVVEVPPVPVVNPPVTAVPPVAEVVPATPAATVNPPAPTARPGVNGGLIPGQTAGTRPSAGQVVGLTKKEIAKWSGPEMRKQMKLRRAEIEKVLAS